MNILIIYDSTHGNTEQIVKTMKAALASATVEMLRPHEVTSERLHDADILMVGSPTQAFHPTGEVTDFISRLPADDLQGSSVLAFDTRIAKTTVDSRLLRIAIGLFGYAAEKIAKRLQKKGGQLILPPEGFLVLGTKGPLKSGEPERAKEWARRALAIVEKR
ncbi:MAG: flavodoxin domain-containing protein [Sporolactobacillus sp.]|jgi:flavodoxin|nr:flavodoxin domain-containing protein [Sporolactobacillus sp.]